MIDIGHAMDVLHDIPEGEPAKEMFLFEGYWFPAGKWSKRDARKWIHRDIPTCMRALSYVTNFTTAVDGGGFSGVWSRRFARVFEHTYIFEPNAFNGEIIHRNLTTSNYTLIQAALSSDDTPVKMCIAGGNFLKIRPDKKRSRDYPCVSIDSMNLKEVGLIKLDIEGMEMAALKGAARTIERDSPVVCLEHKLDKEGIHEHMTSIGYTRQWRNKLDTIYTREG